MSDNLDELRKIAEAATQGVWERFDVTDLDTFGVTDLAHVLASELETEDAVQAVATGVTREDAQHIATFDPPTVLRLLDLVESEAEYAELNPKLAAILRGTAKALKGEPEPLISHSWHDLAEVATELITRLEQAEQDRVKLRNRLDAMRRQRDGYQAQARKLADEGLGGGQNV